MEFSIRAHKYYILVFVSLVLLAITSHPNQTHCISASVLNRSSTSKNTSQPTHQKEAIGEELGRELYPMGSRLPDCTHACEECSPCKRVMISFKCSSESCPIVYRCRCNGKYYHVPSN